MRKISWNSVIGKKPSGHREGEVMWVYDLNFQSHMGSPSSFQDGGSIAHWLLEILTEMLFRTNNKALQFLAVLRVEILYCSGFSSDP